MGQSRGLKLPIAAHTNPSTHRLLHQAVAQFRVRFTLQAPTAAAKALCNQAGWVGGNASWTAAAAANALWHQHTLRQRGQQARLEHSGRIHARNAGVSFHQTTPAQEMQELSQVLAVARLWHEASRAAMNL